MDITRTSVPGIGMLHDCTTREGRRFRILVDRSGQRRLFFYGADPGSRPVAEIVLEVDEADLAAMLLHSRPLPDRVARLERRIDELSTGRICAGRGR